MCRSGGCPNRSDQRCGARRRRGRDVGCYGPSDERADGRFQPYDDGRRRGLHRREPRTGRLHRLGVAARPANGVQGRSGRGRCGGLAGPDTAAGDTRSDHGHGHAARAGDKGRALLGRRPHRSDPARARGGQYRGDRGQRRGVQRPEPGPRSKPARRARSVIRPDRPGPARSQGRGGRVSGRGGHLALAVHAGPGPVRYLPRGGTARSSGDAVRLRLTRRHGALHQQPARTWREQHLWRNGDQRDRWRRRGQLRQAGLQRAPREQSRVPSGGLR